MHIKRERNLNISKKSFDIQVKFKCDKGTNPQFSTLVGKDKLQHLSSCYQDSTEMCQIQIHLQAQLHQLNHQFNVMLYTKKTNFILAH